MNAEQKRAWFGVVIGITCLGGFLILLPFFGPYVAFSAFGFFGFYGFTPFIRRSEHEDERDKAICRRATLIGAMVSYEAFVIGCMGTWGVVYGWHRHSQVSVHALGIITFIGGILLIFSRSVAILVLYGRKTEADNA
jgi:hypothetical protein